ncbi:MAG TPA: glycosyl hydrolase [Bryobacteraceae bacterium]|nr:glycosyl hydrolase [Bryobacteraceae bacterium]
MKYFRAPGRTGWLVCAVAIAHLAGAATIGINHYEFDPAQDGPLLSQLSPAPVPLRMTFYRHDVAGAEDYFDSQVAAATEAGVPILGVLGYSTPSDSSMPSDFDFTEISPFNVSWHTADGSLCWGSEGESGSVRYLWHTKLEDGDAFPRVVEARPASDINFVHGTVALAIPPGHSVVLWAQVGFVQSPKWTGHAVFSVTYANGDDFHTLARLEKRYDGALGILTADLTGLAGTTATLFLNVDAVPGRATGSPVWQAAGILVDGAPMSMTQAVGGNLQSVINYPPQDFGAFAAYAGNLARRYPQIREWEVWNEPNLAFFWRPSVNAAAYCDLLGKVYQAVKAANPDALVVLGGLSPGSGDQTGHALPAVDFLKQIYQAGGEPFFDVLGFHAYGVDPLQDWLPAALQAIRQVMEANGDGFKPVWITETGWYSSGNGSATEAEQAECLRQALAILGAVAYVERVYWYTLRDSGDSGDPEQNYGLFHADGSPKPAAVALTAALQE